MIYAFDEYELDTRLYELRCAGASLQLEPKVFDLLAYLTTRSALEGEIKQVTVLFCDLPDSIDLAERLGPECMHALLQRFFELALDAVHRVGRTHLALAELAQRQSNREAATLHVTEAHHLFTTLHVTAYVQRTVQYASRCGLVCAAPAAPLAGGA